MKKNQLLYPDKKISAQFLDFTSPMLEVLSKPADLNEIEKVLKICFIVWNAVVYADVKGDSHILDNVRENLSEATETRVIINNLISRKRKLFGDDQRLIGEYKISLNKGILNVRAEARSPYSTHIPGQDI